MNVVSCAPSSANEHGDQFRRFGIAGIGRDQMGRAGWLKEGLADLERLERAAAELRAAFALGNVGRHRTCMPMRARETSGAVGHAHDGDPLARHVRQHVRADRLDLVQRRCRRGAGHAERCDNAGYRVPCCRECFSDGDGAGKTHNQGKRNRACMGPCRRERNCHHHRCHAGLPSTELLLNLGSLGGFTTLPRPSPFAPAGSSDRPRRTGSRR
jgi:hypothetical protein